MGILRILGSCSGTEPMPGRHHTSLAVTVGDRNYFFDAGENCAHTAHTMGVDVMKTRAVFISHCHFDHIGGLAGLFWTIRKIKGREKREIADGEVKVYIPLLETWECVCRIQELAGKGKPFPMRAWAQRPEVGTFYDDGAVKVIGYPSHHIPDYEDGTCSCFTYRIEAEGKKIVFSGDIGKPEDLIPAVENGCDLLLCETGHHTVESICRFAETHSVKKLIFLHHGREILENRPTVSEAIGTCRIPVTISNDRDVVNFSEI